MKGRLTFFALFLFVIASMSFAQTSNYFNGFETAENWPSGTTIVASGTDGINASSGSYYAKAEAGAFTRWGGYNSTFPEWGYITSVDIYLNVEGGFANDTRFDFSSAISNSSGDHLRDFIITGGFYNDATGPGISNTNRFIFSASNNSPGWPKDPSRSPIAISTSGWYTFEHYFHNNGSGVLTVDLSIYNSAHVLMGTWTLSNPTDIIGSTVGGNRYGWFVTNGFGTLAIDNTSLTIIPAPYKDNLISVASSINDLYSAGTGDKKTDKKLEEIINHFNKALDSDLWTEDGNIDPKHGNKVFDELKDVVKKLQELIKDKKSAIDDETLLGYINEIVDNTKALAQKAIDDAIAACDGDKNCQKEINKANEELAKAADELAKGKDDKYDNAIDHYKKAWEHAQKALKKSYAIAEENSLNKDEAGLDNSSSIPEKFELGQNYPNPFNPSTNINFALPANEFVTIKIYDVLGKEVANLVNSNMNAGYHTVNWDASNVPSGIYIYRIQAGSFQSVKKMILMK